MTEQQYGEPPQWGDGDWWRRTNTINDIGEKYAFAIREGRRLRRQMWEAERQRRAYEQRMGL